MYSFVRNGDLVGEFDVDGRPVEWPRILEYALGCFQLQRSVRLGREAAHVWSLTLVICESSFLGVRLKHQAMKTHIGVFQRVKGRMKIAERPVSE